MNKAIFLDKDGTINVEKNYVYRPEDWEWIKGSMEAIKGFNRLGYLVIVITNQSGVARGLYSSKDVDRLHAYVSKALAEAGGKIDGYYCCPHHPDYGAKRQCSCRKPEIGLLLQAQTEHQIDLGSSYMIGDKASDIMAGYTAGATPILVMTGYGRSEMSKVPDNTLYAEDLYAAYKLIEGRGMV